jgi:hypothetical protein
MVTALGFSLGAARKFDVQVPINIFAVLVPAAACVRLVRRCSLLGMGVPGWYLDLECRFHIGIGLRNAPADV